MAIERNCQSNYECLVKIKGGGDNAPHPVQPDEARRWEGSLNVEEVFADLSVEASEEDSTIRRFPTCAHKRHPGMGDILSRQAKPGNHPRNIFNQKTVKEHSEDEFVTVFAIYKRLKRSYPILKDVILEELDDLDPEVRGDLEELFGIGGEDERR